MLYFCYFNGIWSTREYSSIVKVLGDVPPARAHFFRLLVSRARVYIFAMLVRARACFLALLVKNRSNFPNWCPQTQTFDDCVLEKVKNWQFWLRNFDMEFSISSQEYHFHSWNLAESPLWFGHQDLNPYPLNGQVPKVHNSPTCCIGGVPNFRFNIQDLEFKILSFTHSVNLRYLISLQIFWSPFPFIETKCNNDYKSIEVGLIQTAA